MKRASESEERLLYFADEIINLTSKEKFAQFDGFIPQNPELYEEDDFVFMDVTPGLLKRPINVSVYTPGQPDGQTKAKRAGQICRLKELSPKELRKRTGEFFLNPFLIEVCFDDYPKIADGFLQYTKSGMKYKEIGGFVTSPAMKAQSILNAQILLGHQFNMENQNYVYLRPENSAFGFKYPIKDLAQLKELFSLRDIPDGYKRRAALRHWVAKHLRRKPTKPDEKVEVRRHLRGKESFDWFGMKGTIFVN